MKKYGNVARALGSSELQKRYELYIQRWKAGLEIGMRGSSSISAHIRRYLFEKYKRKCSKCGWSQKNPYTERIPLEVSHINGDFRDNREENLELICPNCHSLTNSFKSMNKGRGRPVTRGYVRKGSASQLAMAPGLNPDEQ